MRTTSVSVQAVSARLTMQGQRVVREETLLQGLGRVRDIRQDADGYINVAIDGRGHHDGVALVFVHVNDRLKQLQQPVLSGRLVNPDRAGPREFKLAQFACFVSGEFSGAVTLDAHTQVIPGVAIKFRVFPDGFNFSLARLEHFHVLTVFHDCQIKNFAPARSANFYHRCMIRSDLAADR